MPPAQGSNVGQKSPSRGEVGGAARRTGGPGGGGPGGKESGYRHVELLSSHISHESLLSEISYYDFSSLEHEVYVFQLSNFWICRH